jgi:translation elongation factor EF-Ts
MTNLSKAQNRFMQAAASSPEMAKKLGIPQKVAKEFVTETKSMKGKPERVKKKA